MSNPPTEDPDHDIDDAEDDRASIRERLQSKTDDFAEEVRPGDVVIDMVEDRPLFVRRKVAESAVDYYADTDFDLTTYKKHRWLPVTPDDAVFECVFLPTHLRDIPASKKKQTYDYPRGRLARVPVEWFWGSDERHQDEEVAVRLSKVLADADRSPSMSAGDLIDMLQGAFGDDVVDEAAELSSTHAFVEDASDDTSEGEDDFDDDDLGAFDADQGFDRD